MKKFYFYFSTLYAAYASSSDFNKGIIGESKPTYYKAPSLSHPDSLNCDDKIRQFNQHLEDSLDYVTRQATINHYKSFVDEFDNAKHVTAEMNSVRKIYFKYLRDHIAKTTYSMWQRNHSVFTSTPEILQFDSEFESIKLKLFNMEMNKLKFICDIQFYKYSHAKKILKDPSNNDNIHQTTIDFLMGNYLQQDYKGPVANRLMI